MSRQSRDVVPLRDYFAGQALNGYLSAPGPVGIDARDNSSHVSVWAYELADAMLAERDKREETEVRDA